MGRQNLENAVVHRKAEIKAGQYTYEQVKQDIMKNQFGEAKVTPAEVIEHIQKYDKNFKVPDDFAQKRSEREALSQRAREKMVDYAIFDVQNKVEERYGHLLPKGTDFHRHERTIVYMGSSEEELAFNNKYMELRFKTDAESKAEFGRLVMERIEKACRTVEEARGYTTEQMVENYEKITQDFNLIIEMQTLKNADEFYGFTEEHRKRMKEIEVLTSVATDCEARVTMAASVWYPDVPLESISYCDYYNYENGSNFMELEYLAQDKGEEKLIGGAMGPSTMGAQDIQSTTMHCKNADRDWVEYTIHKGGSDSRMLFDVTGRQLSRSDDDVTYTQNLLGHRQPLIVGTADKGFVTVAVDRTKDPVEYIYDDPELNSAVARSMSDRTEQMLKQITGATPWWMTTGSQQFKDMTEAMKAFAAATKDLTFPLTSEKAQQLRDASARMKACSEEYIAYKMQQREGNIVGEDGSYRGKNSRETRRLQAADELQKMCDSMNVLLLCEKGNTAVVKDMVDKLHQQDERKAREEKERAEQERRQKLEAAEKNKAPLEERCTRSEEELLRITGEIKLGSKPLKSFESDSLPSLYENAKSALDSLPGKAAGNKKYQGIAKSVITDMIGNFIRYDLVQQERKLYRQEHDGAAPTEPQPIEKLLKEKDLLKNNDPVLCEMVGTLTPKRLEEILANGDLKKMGQQYLAKVQQKVQQKEVGNEKKIEKVDEKKNEMVAGGLGNNK